MTFRYNWILHGKYLWNYGTEIFYFLISGFIGCEFLFFFLNFSNFSFSHSSVGIEFGQLDFFLLYPKIKKIEYIFLKYLIYYLNNKNHISDIANCKLPKISSSIQNTVVKCKVSLLKYYIYVEFINWLLLYIDFKLLYTSNPLHLSDSCG